jgi:hypothetical protein
MMRRVAVSGATRAPRCRGWHLRIRWPGLWPMVRRKAVIERYAALWCLWLARNTCR